MSRSMLQNATISRISDPTLRVAKSIFGSINSPVTRRLLANLEKGEFLDVVSAEIDIKSYADAPTLRDDYLAVELLSKYPCLDTGIDTTKVALTKFFDAELSCAQTAARLQKREVNGVFSPYTPHHVFHMARRKISHLLGPIDWDQVERSMHFGPGASTSVRSSHGDAYFKYKAKPCATSAAAVLAYTCISRIPTWFAHVAHLCGQTPETIRELPVADQINLMIDIVPGNRVVTVPKNAKTDRTIAIEPTMNGYIQSGIGGVIRDKLKRVGVDLNDQTWNQDLARLGSLTGRVCTIDLSAASDSVSMELVRQLLPDDWVTAMDLCRSPVGVLPDGKVVTYHKVSSMGNGFTFELESLIFWALASSVCQLFNADDRLIAVYGDDIIVPTNVSHSLLWVLSYAGFTPNAKKTFVDGWFRESCGKHYFRGSDVTPFYVRESVETPNRIFWLCNQIHRHSRFSWGLDGRMRSAYEIARGSLPSRLRSLWIPEGVGDTGLIADFSVAQPQRDKKSARAGWEIHWVFSALLPIVKSRVPESVPYLLRQLSKLEGHTDSPYNKRFVRWSRFHPGRIEVARGVFSGVGDGIPNPNTGKAHLVRGAVVQWPDFGPWLV